MREPFDMTLSYRPDKPHRTARSLFRGVVSFSCIVRCFLLLSGRRIVDATLRFSLPSFFAARLFLPAPAVLGSCPILTALSVVRWKCHAPFLAKFGLSTL